MAKDYRRPQTVVYQYELSEGWIVLAGRTDADNDRLSLTLAEPDDWWFHAHGLPGSHVLLRARPGLEPSRTLLKEAGIVPVVATQARYVSKPKDAKPGTVCIRKEITFKVRPALPCSSPPAPTRLGD